MGLLAMGSLRKFAENLQKFCGIKPADCKRGRRKEATSKKIKNRQKASKSFSTLFDNFRAGQKTSKIVKKCQKVFRHFPTIFARHLFSGPFCNPLIKGLIVPGKHAEIPAEVAEIWRKLLCNDPFPNDLTSELLMNIANRICESIKNVTICDLQH